jgi:FkbM family methyltransferase
MALRPIEWAGRALRKAGTEILRRNGIEGTWIDVGAHRGDITLWHARHNPGLKIYAFEPNLRLAAKLMGRAPNYLPIPMAVAERDGYADFHINAFDAASSLLPLHQEGLRTWVGVENHKEESVVSVPTIRLDTFMDRVGLEKVDFLKIDAQGMDLAVIRSAGSRLADIAKITLEVEIAPITLYEGAPSKREVLEFLGGAGFSLIKVEKQTHGQEENLTFVRNNSF